MFKDLIHKWDEVLLSTTDTPDKLTSVYKTRLRDSEQSKTTLALQNQDMLQQTEFASKTRLKKMVKKYLDQKTKDRNIDARNDWAASGPPVSRKGDDRNKGEDRKTSGL